MDGQKYTWVQIKLKLCPWIRWTDQVVDRQRDKYKFFGKTSSNGNARGPAAAKNKTERTKVKKQKKKCRENRRSRMTMSRPQHICKRTKCTSWSSQVRKAAKHQQHQQTDYKTKQHVNKFKRTKFSLNIIKLLLLLLFGWWCWSPASPSSLLLSSGGRFELAPATDLNCFFFFASHQEIVSFMMFVYLLFPSMLRCL